eukprot:jgi/Mesvir1/23771/Mv10597-RA.1
MAASGDFKLVGKGETASVVYGGEYDPDCLDIRLLEVTNDVLAEILEGGVCFKGNDENDDVVVCTHKKTFSLKAVESSNAMLLVDQTSARAPEAASASTETAEPGDAGSRRAIEVCASATGHLELVEMRPQFGPLRALLAERPLSDEEAADLAQVLPLKDEPNGAAASTSMDVGTGSTPGLYSWQQLSARVKASDWQLRDALTTLGAVEICGSWRVLEEGYRRRVLSMLLLSAVEHEWPLSCIPERAAVAALREDGVPPPVTRLILATFGDRVTPEGDDGGGTDSFYAGNANNAKDTSNTNNANDNAIGRDDPAAVPPGRSGAPRQAIWALDEARVCVCAATHVLASAPPHSLRVVEFMRRWEGAVPAGMVPRLEMLRGEALVEPAPGTGEEVVVAWPVDALPQDDAAARFRALFDKRRMWAYDDLVPYVRGLQGPGETIESLLLQYARKFQPRPECPVLYCAR